MNPTALTVSQGVVSDFSWSWEMGGYYAFFDRDTFLTRLYGQTDPQTGQPLPDVEVRGTIKFGPPIRQN